MSTCEMHGLDTPGVHTESPCKRVTAAGISTTRSLPLIGHFANPLLNIKLNHGSTVESSIEELQYFNLEETGTESTIYR